MSRSVEPKARLASTFFALTIFGLLLLYPAIQLITVALRLPAEPGAAEAPDAPAAGFAAVFSNPSFTGWLATSAGFAAVLAAAAVAVAAAVASALGRRSHAQAEQARASAGVPVATLFGTPFLMLPLYIAAVRLDLVNPLIAFIILFAAIALPFCIWLLNAHFSVIPPAALEAARIDGASRSDTFRFIVLPLIWRGLVAAFLFSFIAAWTMSVVATLVVPDFALFNPATAPAMPINAATTLVLVAPLLLCFTIFAGLTRANGGAEAAHYQQLSRFPCSSR